LKIQLAYRYTGEKTSELLLVLKKIKEILISNNYKVYITVLDPDRPKEKKELYYNTLKKIDSCDILLALIRSNEKSEGMLMEIGYAIGKNKKIISAIKKDVTTHLTDLSNEIIVFENNKDLFNKIKNFNFNQT
jgi:nucleoside 2-deoxyribosyltransferase